MSYPDNNKFAKVRSKRLANAVANMNPSHLVSSFLVVGKETEISNDDPPSGTTSAQVLRKRKRKGATTSN